MCIYSKLLESLRALGKDKRAFSGNPGWFRTDFTIALPEKIRIPKKGEKGGSCRLRCLVPSGHNFRGLDCRLAAIFDIEFLIQVF